MLIFGVPRKMQLQGRRNLGGGGGGNNLLIIILFSKSYRPLSFK
jgi:hypothetical protein